MKIARKLVPTISTIKMKLNKNMFFMFNKLSKPSTFSYKFSCKFEQCNYIQKPYLKTLHPTLKPLKSLLYLTTNPTIYPTKYVCSRVPQKPHPKKKR